MRYITKSFLTYKGLVGLVAAVVISANVGR